MQNNVLNYLYDIVGKCPDKTAYSDGELSLTFKDVYSRSRAIGSFLHGKNVYKKPVVIFMKRGPEEISAFLGVISGGCFYVPVDEEMPAGRIQLILNNVQSPVIICDDYTLENAKSFQLNGAEIVLYSEIINTPENPEALDSIYKKALDIDPIYIVFTSGSTGIPKGVAACHRSVIDYIEQLSEILNFNENTVFGNQTPLYFDACLKEIYPTLKFGATAYIIPKKLFSIPMSLVEYLNQHKINTICWVVSALTMVSAFGTFKELKPEYLHTVAFGSELFPVKQLRLWQQAVPNAKLTNLYGPTECTGMCCYYHVERDFEDNEIIPIGKPFPNREIFLLKEGNQLAEPGEEGEICVRGTAVTLGYYNDPERTSAAFTQNPLNKAYPELIYRTGDIGKFNSRGELLFMSRKDHQIKHMGHRVELGEVEININMLHGVQMAACIYDGAKKKIVLYYVGELSPGELTAAAKPRLPRYMLPNKIVKLEKMPLTPNGKINRVKLTEMYNNK